MASILLAFSFILLALREMGRTPHGEDHPRPWQGAVLIASSIIGVLIVVITEALSVFHALRLPYLAAAWLFVAALVSYLEYRHGLLKSGWLRVLDLLRGLGRVEAALLAFFSILAILVLSVAFVSPPNNVDSLQYHMPRVLHWVQNASLDHFATPYDSQDSRPYWAELAILNLRVLWGSDRPANLPQALSLLALAAAAAGISRHLGGNRRTQILSGALAFSIPMALLQATTPKNDVVSAFWVLSTGYFVVLESTEGLAPRERWALFSSVALAMLTKGTGIPFVAALLAWYSLVRVLRSGVRRLIVENAPAVLVVVLVNGGFWYRNTTTYGGPYGSNLPLGLSTTIETPAAALTHRGGMTASNLTADQTRIDPGESPDPDRLSQASMAFGLEEYFARLSRMLAMHFVTPSYEVNQALLRALRMVPAVFPDVYIESLELAAWNHEMTAGNPLHVVLIAGAFGALAFMPRRRKLDPLLMLSITASFGLFLISFAGCIDSVFCMRYQLGFFPLAVPVVAVTLSRVAPRAVAMAALVILAYAAPYVVFNNMRPVVGIPPWPTRIRSVFAEDVNTILFAQSPEIRDEYEYVATRVQGEGCRRVGLVTTRDDLEYTFWRLLGAPDSQVVIEHLRASPQTQRYLDPTFSPCAVICTDCAGLPATLELPLASDFGHVRLYLQTTN
jgi:hypothetical protein